MSSSCVRLVYDVAIPLFLLRIIIGRLLCVSRWLIMFNSFFYFTTKQIQGSVAKLHFVKVLVNEPVSGQNTSD